MRAQLRVLRLDAEHLGGGAIAQAHAAVGIEDHQRGGHGFERREQVGMRGLDAAARFGGDAGQLARFAERQRQLALAEPARACTIFANELISTPISSAAQRLVRGA